MISIYEIIRGSDYSGGGVPHLNLNIVKKIKVPIPSKEKQLEIVEKIQKSYQNIKNLELLKTETETKIKAIVNSLWAVE